MLPRAFVSEKERKSEKSAMHGSSPVMRYGGEVQDGRVDAVRRLRSRKAAAKRVFACSNSVNRQPQIAVARPPTNSHERPRQYI